VEFWDKHDTTDYLEFVTPVTADMRLKKRHFEVEIDSRLVEALQKRAKRLRKPVKDLVADLLREGLSTAA
jgi:hypothetical protein